MRLTEGDSLLKVCFGQKSFNVVMSDNSIELWALWRERQRLLGFIYQLFRGMGGVLCVGVTEAHTPLPLPLPPLHPPSSSCSPGRSQTIVVVPAVQKAAECFWRVGVCRTLAPRSLL